MKNQIDKFRIENQKKKTYIDDNIDHMYVPNRYLNVYDKQYEHSIHPVMLVHTTKF